MPAASSSSPLPSVNLRRQALAALCLCDPVAKCEATHALWAALPLAHPDPQETLEQPPSQPWPGRPAAPLLLPPESVPQRSPFTEAGMVALIHAITHIEFNAINLALDAVWRFPHMPPAFYTDWLRVAQEEATHFEMLRGLLQSVGADYGDCAAHDGLWAMCVKTQHDVTARMALVPRTLEARGLDATPLIQAKLQRVATPLAQQVVAALDIILRDEIGHVAIGNHWYGWLCQQQGLEPLSHYRSLARTHSAPRPRAPFNHSARLAAGFSDAELSYLFGTGS